MNYKLFIVDEGEIIDEVLFTRKEFLKFIDVEKLKNYYGKVKLVVRDKTNRIVDYSFEEFLEKIN